MRCSFWLLVLVGAPAFAEPAAPPAPWSIQVGGYLQPQLRLRENSPVQFDQNGFRFARVRPTLQAETRLGDLTLSAHLEAELQPTFALQDAFLTASYPLPGRGGIAIDAGQLRVPISRQQLLSDSRLSFVDKAQLALRHPAGVSLAPGRDLGARATLIVPEVPQVAITVGAFDGEGPNQVENINESLFYAGRLEITPIGKATLAESAFGDTFVTLAASAGRNKLATETVTYLGADLAGSWKGLSGSVEYLRADHDGTSAGAIDYVGQGWVAQVAYLLPIALPPVARARLELAARVEEIDRNDTTPIAQPGDPEQSVREYTACVSYYLRAHSVKVQLALSRFDELEDRTVQQQDATYANDQLLLQLTYRLE